MITLAIDTCDRMGSVGLRSKGKLVGVRGHADEDYSSWLLPAVESLLAEAAVQLDNINLLAAATGPGSFTGVRVGLCAVKAWAEVYGLRVVGVSRLSALARHARSDGWVAAAYDAHRNQLFGGIFRREGGICSPVDEEMVIGPAEFLELVNQKAHGEAVQWICPQPELIRDLPSWQVQEGNGSFVSGEGIALANAIGELAEERAARGDYTEVLQLDANYVRRSDAEIYWKGPAHRVGG